MISIAGFDLKNYHIEISRHAFLRAIEREIYPDQISATIKGGRISFFGKHGIRFTKDYKGHFIICVGVLSVDTIKIVTVERK